jgi:hypothetical protein
MHSKYNNSSSLKVRDSCNMNSSYNVSSSGEVYITISDLSLIVFTNSIITDKMKKISIHFTIEKLLLLSI